ncbi:hypothetical protein SLS54_008751 [Diplodia seriata]
MKGVERETPLWFVLRFKWQAVFCLSIGPQPEDFCFGFPTKRRIVRFSSTIEHLAVRRSELRTERGMVILVCIPVVVRHQVMVGFRFTSS